MKGGSENTVRRWNVKTAIAARPGKISYSFTHIALCNLCGSMWRPNKRGSSRSAARRETQVRVKLQHPLLPCTSGQEGDEATRGTAAKS